MFIRNPKENPHKPQNLKEMLRKSPASNASTAILKSADLF